MKERLALIAGDMESALDAPMPIRALAVAVLVQSKNAVFVRCINCGGCRMMREAVNLYRPWLGLPQPPPPASQGSGQSSGASP